MCEMGRRNTVHCLDKAAFEQNHRSRAEGNQTTEALSLPKMKSQDLDGNKMPMPWALKVGRSFCYAMVLLCEVCLHKLLVISYFVVHVGVWCPKANKHNLFQYELSYNAPFIILYPPYI